MDNGLDGVFQFLYQSVALQDVDDSNVEQKSFTLTIASRNSTWSITKQDATPEITSSAVAVRTVQTFSYRGHNLSGHKMSLKLLESIHYEKAS